MSAAHKGRHHHYGYILFFCTIIVLGIVSSFGYTYFTCYDAEKKLITCRIELLGECKKLCDTVPKFSILATKYDMALYNTVNKAKIARKNFYVRRPMPEKADAYYTLEDALARIASTLEDNRLATRDKRWSDVTKDLRNITNRVNIAQTNYTWAVHVYNATLKGDMRELWLNVLDFKPADPFMKPAHLMKQPGNATE
jgi:hypothetical protein